MMYGLALSLVFLIACGAAAPEQEAPPAGEATQSPPAMGDTPAPTAMAEPTPETPAEGSPSGTLTVGQKEIGGYDGHPALAVNPALFVSQTAPLGEGLWYPDIDGEIQPWLLE